MRQPSLTDVKTECCWVAATGIARADVLVPTIGVDDAQIWRTYNKLL